MSIDLASLYFSPALPEEDGLIVRGVEEEGGDALLQLPEGSYSFRREKGSLRIDPVFPQDGWIRGFNLAIPLSLAFSTVLTVHDVFYPKRAALQITETFSLSAATLSSYGLTVSLIGFDIALYRKRRKAEEAFSYLRIAERAGAALRRGVLRAGGESAGPGAVGGSAALLHEGVGWLQGFSPVPLCFVQDRPDLLPDR